MSNECSRHGDPKFQRPESFDPIQPADRGAVKVGSFTLCVLFVCVMAALTPLAHASPPDPSWVAGLWDDADYDDIVILITASVGAVEPPLLSDARLGQPVVGFIPPVCEEPVPASTAAANQTRAPPVA